MTASGNRNDGDERFRVHLGKPPSKMSDEELDDLTAELASHMDLAIEKTPAPAHDEPDDAA